MGYPAWKTSILRPFYRVKHPLREFRRIRNNIKFCFQRAIRGWSDADTWSIDCWFLNVMPDMLRHLAKQGNSYPYGFDNPKDWIKTLRRIAYLLDEADEDKCSKKNPYERILYYEGYDTEKKNKISEKWFEYEKKLNDYRDRCKNKALKMFSEYFWNLWD